MTRDDWQKASPEEPRWSYHRPLRENWPAIGGSLIFYGVLFAVVIGAVVWLI